jgi:phage shock protein C
MTVNCSKCGAANEDFAEYCASCGEPVKKEDPTKETTTETTSPSEKKESKLYRSRTNKMISGLSAGFAKEFNMDVDLVRILWVIFFVVTGGTAIIVYVILWAIIPLEPKTETEENTTSESKEK